MKSVAISICIVMVIITVISQLLQPVEGVIILEGYEHGVVICGDEKDAAERIVDDEFTAYIHNGNTVIINAGHDSDPQVNELLVLATSTCAQYN